DAITYICLLSKGEETQIEEAAPISLQKRLFTRRIHTEKCILKLGCDWSCKSIGNDIKDLKTLILKLQENIQTLKNDKGDTNSPNQDDLVEDIISEIEPELNAKATEVSVWKFSVESRARFNLGGRSGERRCRILPLRLCSKYHSKVVRFISKLRQTLDPDVRVVNYIKSSTLNSRLFTVLYEDLDSDHKVLLFHTEVRWLSKSNMFSRLYELKEEEFCIDKQELPVKESYYRHIFNTELNLRFHKPYSDTCSRCDNLQNLIKYSTNEDVIKNAKQELELHQRKAQKATDAKKAYNAENKNDSKNTAVICFDLQQALPTPLLTTSKS
ncbi:unnamed protein product, partial [Acanthoscelides obtectus]